MSLEEKKRIRKVRPNFVRTQAQHIKRVSRTGYRRPKGLHNKMGKNGHIKAIATGYGYPKNTRNMSAAGLQIVHIQSAAELNALDPKKVLLIIPSTLGMRKKLVLLETAVQKQFQILDITDITKYIAAIKEKRDMRKKDSAVKAKDRADKKEASLKAKEGKEAKKAPKTEEKPAEKKEQDKVLISKK